MEYQEQAASAESLSRLNLRQEMRGAAQADSLLVAGCGRLSLRGPQTVAYAGRGDDILRLGSLVLNFLSQISHVNPDRLGITFLAGQHLLEDHFRGHNAIPILEQAGENVELRPGQRNFFTPTKNPAAQ